MATTPTPRPEALDRAPTLTLQGSAQFRWPPHHSGDNERAVEQTTGVWTTKAARLSAREGRLA